MAISGLRIGGKTGTAETGVTGRNTTWFICFAGPDDGSPPHLAVAVVLEGQTLTGGATAAPIARQVIESLLSQPGNWARRVPRMRVLLCCEMRRGTK